MKRILSFTYGWVVPAVLLLTACSTEPKPVPYGNANCTHCNMTITDVRYGAELVNDKGKPYFFDAVECLAAYVNSKPEEGQKASFLMVTDFSNPTELINVNRAHFVRSAALPSPMGMNLLAVSTPEAAKKIQQEQGAELLTWDQVLAIVKNDEKHH
ncbi:nitrous oxide reductase accessory protein NosL [Rufibacter sediminis]|uniref:Nitrous oxide reductase accessory protein NosL n=1 Tax=Rufibacter sediminis TaxID=2762756 RepID=A0ABR6VPE6_9BACT|nr:nitrous oxide reductase accessory protein NosL [Rufibacter sediminis]MBC3539020.1 nitrous oxide reductase accessory protein NosL [Rufibacter sediminis]